MMYPKPAPAWLDEAFKHVGQGEIPGKKHNPVILRWLTSLGAWWSEDETPWCGTFAAHCLKTAGLVPPKHWYCAKAYADHGSPCSRDPIPFGAICVKSRKGGGHVFFAVAQSRDGETIYGLGGNQGNRVSIVPFKLAEIDAVRWPVSDAIRLALPVASSLAEVGGSAPGSEA